jgi:hypothetical protein
MGDHEKEQAHRSLSRISNFNFEGRRIMKGSVELKGVYRVGVGEASDVKSDTFKLLGPDDPYVLHELPLPVAESLNVPIAPIRIVDCICSPDAADELIGDLLEGFARRVRSRRYATVWLWAQVARVVFDQAIKLLRTYTQARAGK